MRVNIYAEEMTQRVEIVEKVVEGTVFTGLRFYLELPVTTSITDGAGQHIGYTQHKGPFLHKPYDDDSSAITFWGKTDLRILLQTALAILNQHYENRGK